MCCAARLLTSLSALCPQCNRFPLLAGAVAEHTRKLITDATEPLYNFVRNLVKRELAYINTENPEFATSELGRHICRVTVEVLPRVTPTALLGLTSSPVAVIRAHDIADGGQRQQATRQQQQKKRPQAEKKKSGGFFGFFGDDEEQQVTMLLVLLLLPTARADGRSLSLSLFLRSSSSRRSRNRRRTARSSSRACPRSSHSLRTPASSRRRRRRSR